MSLIDVSDAVEADEGSTQLRFENEKQQAKFELGVCMAVHKWEELNIAVVNSWGGPNSAEKRDWISGIVIDLFDEKIVDLLLIEETLLYAMLDEFDAEIDNDSALLTAKKILDIYRDVKQANFDEVDQMFAAWLEKQNNNTGNNHAVTLENNSDESSSSEDEHEHVYVSVEGQDSANENSGQRGPVVDDDGFELVQKKR